MKNDLVYSTTFKVLNRGHNQPIEMTLGNLIDELEKLHAIPEDTVWQMRLALMHKEQEQL